MTTLVKSKLSLGELYALESELNGSRNPQTAEVVTKGLLAHKGINMKMRYYVGEVAEMAAAEKKKIDALKDELIMKLGEPAEEGRVTLPTVVSKKAEDGTEVLDPEGNAVMELNPKFIEFNEEMNKLTAEEKEFRHFPFSIEDFDIDTDESYPVLFKLLKKSNVTEESEEPAQ